MSPLVLLGHRLDTLELSFEEVPGSEGIDPPIWYELDQAKKRAQRFGEPQPFEIAGHTVYVEPKGLGVYSWRARCEGLDLRMAFARNVPPLSVWLGARPLAEHGAQSLLDELAPIAKALNATNPHVTRADVAVDFQGWVPTTAEMANVVCSASFRPVYPSVEAPETFMFGKGQMVVRVYDKTKQIAVKHLEWWRDVWVTCPDYDPALPVWRIEGQMRSTVLRELGIVAPEDVVKNLGQLLDQSMRWAQLRVPGTDKTKTRWPEHPRWEQIRTAAWSGKPVERLRAKSHMLAADKAAARAVSALATFGAHMGVYDLGEALQLLREHSEFLQAVHPSRPTFHEEVELRCRRLGIADGSAEEGSF